MKPLLLDITYEGRRIVRGASRARHTPVYGVPARTVVSYRDAEGDKRLEFDGDLAFQTALDAARERIPHLDAGSFITCFNSQRISWLSRLS